MTGQKISIVKSQIMSYHVNSFKLDISDCHKLPNSSILKAFYWPLDVHNINGGSNENNIGNLPKEKKYRHSKYTSK